MALPEAVQRQIDEADAIEAGLNQAPAGDSMDEPADTPKEAPREEPQTDPRDERIAELERELQSARVEQGRVRALNQQLRQAQEQIEALESQKAQAPQETAQAPPVSNAKREELVDSYGEDLVGYMEQVAATQAQKLQAEIDRLKGETGEVRQQQAQSRQDRFWSELKAAHPDWQSVQATPEGQAFLLTKVPYDEQDRTFDDLLQSAAQNLNAQAAIKVFNGIKDAAGKGGAPQQRAKAQVVPGKGPGGAPPQSNHKPTITQKEVHRASLEFAKDKDMTIPSKYGCKTIEEFDDFVNLAAIEGRLQ